MIRWEICKQDFDWDSDDSWRDIYVHSTTLDDWRSLYSLLRQNHSPEYFVDNSPNAIPNTIEEIMAAHKEASPFLRFRVESILVCCHFFFPDEIEFSIDPREITSQENLNTLLGFMRQVGNAINKQVILTPENFRKKPIISYEPDSGEFQYHPIAT
jgi:hypothetical protein